MFDVSLLKDALPLIAPGAIILIVHDRFQIKKQTDLQTKVFFYAVVSAAYFAIASPAFNALANANWHLWILNGLEYVILPLIIGLAAVFVSSRDWISKISDKLNFRHIHPDPTAWDRTFSKRSGKESYWIIVILNTGEKYAGPFDEESFASSEASERDIFISSVWDAKTDGTWEQLAPKRGILLCGRDIKSIEFFKPDNEKEQVNDREEG